MTAGKNTNKAVFNINSKQLPEEYFRPRDFEYAQPLYDLSFLLEIDAITRQIDIPKYRTFALWKAALKLDGYTTNVDQWLENPNSPELLDYHPSTRIREYLRTIREIGTLSELDIFNSPTHLACLRLRGIRGLGVKYIADALAKRQITEEWQVKATKAASVKNSLITEIWQGTAQVFWETAHIIPPLIRLLHHFEEELGTGCLWETTPLGDGLDPIVGDINVQTYLPLQSTEFENIVRKVANKDRFFRIDQVTPQRIKLRHRLGWGVCLCISNETIIDAKSLIQLTRQSDILLSGDSSTIRGDLHVHTNWSDGTAALQTMIEGAQKNGLEYIAITDHSRSSKLQGGLTPVTWIRQAVSLSLLRTKIKILHGIELDILQDGSLDLPAGLLNGMDIVIGSIHTSWDSNIDVNTDRIIRAIESGCIDIIGHPTAALLGTPGNPTYSRPPVEVDWDLVFEICEKWNVALEYNCFPSRLDLLLPLLIKASKAGCWISFGSDAHSRAHLSHLRIVQRVLLHIDSNRVLNLLSYHDLMKWLKNSRQIRASIPKRSHIQPDLFSNSLDIKPAKKMNAMIANHEMIPEGSRVVGLDLTASKAKPTGVAVLDGLNVRTVSLVNDDEIIAFIYETKPSIVSIDSPLGLPGGEDQVSSSAGIVRIAEYDLSSIGIHAYPALIDSMKPLTLRGIKLRHEIEAMPNAPTVIESYPGAAQDILCIPRKQKGLELLRSGLRELGLQGPGLDTDSHDEMDAITSAIVGRFFEAGDYEPMGIKSEAQLIVPKIHPLIFEKPPIICLAGKTGVGKSVVARYLALFYGFYWLRTRELIRLLLIEDLQTIPEERIYKRPIDKNNIKDSDLTEFGIFVLEQLKQEPLIRKLHAMVSTINSAIVVDAVRDLTDYEILLSLGREVILWFVDAPESYIQSRFIQRQKLLKKPVYEINRIDQNNPVLKASARNLIRNDSSLEDLRWKVDDELFSLITISNK